MDPSYNQYIINSEADTLNQNIDPNYNVYWDYSTYNGAYTNTDPSQEYYQTHYDDNYYTYSDDAAMTSWDVLSPGSELENDAGYYMDGQNYDGLSSSLGLESAYSSDSIDSSQEIDNVEESMLHDKINFHKKNKSGKIRLKGPLKKIHQRQAANVRERKRMRTINDAFELLRQRVPQASEDKKTSKVDTLKLAVKYISELTDVLKTFGDANIPGLRETKCNRKVKVIYACPEFHHETGHLVYGHSLSWCDVTQTHMTSDNKLVTKLWVPEIPSADELQAIQTTTDI